eukprot:GHVU01169355.1.p1 GENE.GHVU01169355.1~~GHVU01169355.1.p1  ORF type:complete len:334 (-),score=49.80 GHVU01169355.1:735-1736(-)
MRRSVGVFVAILFSGAAEFRCNGFHFTPNEHEWLFPRAPHSSILGRRVLGRDVSADGAVGSRLTSRLSAQPVRVRPQGADDDSIPLQVRSHEPEAKYALKPSSPAEAADVNAAFYQEWGVDQSAGKGDPVLLPRLPWAVDALAPLLSRKQLGYHYAKHHAGYVKRLNLQLAEAQNADLAKLTLAEIVARAEPGPLYNNAAQIHNHNLFWGSISPPGGRLPTGTLEASLVDSFGSIEAFKRTFADTAKGHFGSGWTFLVVTPEGRLKVEEGHDAQSPLSTTGNLPILTLDIWEHGYYLDYQNDRATFVEKFLEFVDWEATALRLDEARALFRRG